jgi:iron complex transport system ATP-binding protein
MGILGANGCGKTTLLKSICGILPHKGTCLLENIPLEGMSSRDISKMCSYIPQRSGISIDISVLDVVLMGFNPQLGLLERPTKAMQQTAMETLAQVGLAEKAHVNYMHLSEGQKQLCIMARTLIAGSKLLLLDEPESALDFRYRYQILSYLHNWVKQSQSSAIVTLHDPVLALNYCECLLLLAEGNTLGILHPRTDTLETMQQMLSRIYGEISLQYVTAKNGSRQLIMINEEML